VDRRTPDEIEKILFEVKQNNVANHVAVVVTRHELLGFVRFEILEAVDPSVGEKLQGVGAGHIHVGHMIGLIEKHAALLPGALLVSPIRIFAGDNGIHVRPSLGIAKMIDWISRRLEHILKTLVTHCFSPGWILFAGVDLGILVRRMEFAAEAPRGR
jgi:hypothetical protein